MPRPATGSIRSRIRNGHAELTLRFSAYGRRYELPAGTEDETRARARLDEILDRVRRGEWQPPRQSKPCPAFEEPTFGEFAEGWFRQVAPGLSAAGRSDYLWQLNQHLLPHFAPLLLSEITVQAVDAYRQAKVAEGILGPTSINKTIARLAQVLDLAIEHYPGLLPANPARGKRRRLPPKRPQRSFLEPDQVMAVLDAARELDREAREDRQRIGRRAIMATFILGGLRSGELCSLEREAVDLATGRLYVRSSKTEAGVRVVPISGFLRDELSEYLVQALLSRWMFPTATGKRRDRDGLRNRIFASVIKRTNENLAKAERPLIQAGLTPHGLRRTFISLALECGENPRNVMAWAGHSDPDVTMRIYAQILSRPGQRGLAQRLLWEPGMWGECGTDPQNPVPSGDPTTLRAA